MTEEKESIIKDDNTVQSPLHPKSDQIRDNIASTNSDKVEVVCDANYLAQLKHMNKKFQSIVDALEDEDGKHYTRDSGWWRGKMRYALFTDEFPTVEIQQAFYQRIKDRMGDTPFNLVFIAPYVIEI